MRNHTEIRFSDTTGNGKFSGKPDLPFEIFFLVPRSPAATAWQCMQASRVPCSNSHAQAGMHACSRFPCKQRNSFYVPVIYSTEFDH